MSGVSIPKGRKFRPKHGNKAKFDKIRIEGTHFPTHCLGSSLWLGFIDAALMNSYEIVLQREGKEFLG